jgi:hypothetical protein
MSLRKDQLGREIASVVISNYCASLPAVSQKEVVLDSELAPVLSRTWTFETYLKPKIDEWISWLALSNEQTNFTYGLTRLNELQLAGFTDVITDCGIEKCLQYFNELKQDKVLREHLDQKTLASPERQFADLGGGFGRRIGWYAFVRITKPKLVVETGVDKGLGSCVIAAALMRNAAEGYPGRYLGTDINPKAGYLFSDSYADMGKILYGDSIESLSSLTDSIDLFINDSDHSQDYEAREYQVIHSKLSENAIILADNAHATDALFDYSLRENKKFLFFKEQPESHFYPGAGIGVSFKPARAGRRF